MLQVNIFYVNYVVNCYLLCKGHGRRKGGTGGLSPLGFWNY